FRPLLATIRRSGARGAAGGTELLVRVAGAIPGAGAVAGQLDVLARNLRVALQVALDALTTGLGLDRTTRNDGAASGVLGKAQLGEGGSARLGARLDELFVSGHATADVGQASGDLRLGDVVLVGRQRDGGQDGDDRHDDHQFDQGKALLL